MEMHQYNTYIPFETGDLISAEGYINEYEIIDILTIYSAKTRTVETILKLKDIAFNNIDLWKFTDHKWKLITVNCDRKEVSNE